ncbi:MAG: sigma-54-dependent Fis family transcriptional regulator [Deltaproteobacteria bacterium]|nr:sigma-54-dependent Fis family transcriptional regulator [Deltaproteobacteria bacterium]
MLTLALPAVSEAPHAQAFRAFDAIHERWARARALGVVADGPAHAEGVGSSDLEDRRAQVAAAFACEGPLGPLGLVGDAIAAASEAGYTALLADPEGIIVSARASERFTSTAARVRLVEGASWNESRRGTNAIGTALFEGRAVAVVGGAHFERKNHGLVCYAAPVRDPLGDIVAVFDVTSEVAFASPLIGVLVETVAGALAQVLREAAWARAHPGGLGAMRARVEAAKGPMWLVERGWPGRVLAASGGVDPAMTGGLDWERAAAAARGDGRVEVAGVSYRAEPIFDHRGRLLAVLTQGEGRPVTRGRFERPAHGWQAPQVDTRPGVRARAEGPDRKPGGPASSGGAFARISGSDPAIVEARSLAERFAKTALPVLLLAETGTGKELFARGIHAASPRAKGPFVAVNCGAISPTLLESELFGYGPGAFTGASPRGQIGRIGAAHGGTLFLDEVAEMSLAAQAALLRVLEDGSYARVGEPAGRQVDVRLVCATCRDLSAMVDEGKFRRDLYYRIRGAVLTLPPLRARRDIAELCRALAGDASLSEAALVALGRHTWPGNVRELKMTLEVARVMADGGVIEVAHLPADMFGRHVPGESVGRMSDTSAERVPAQGIGTRVDAERSALSAALMRAGGNLSGAARMLGVARTTLYRMLRRHGLGSE